MSNLSDIFRNNMKYYRHQNHISQEKLSEITGLHQTYISDVERNKRNPSLKTIDKIAKGLNVKAYKLLK